MNLTIFDNHVHIKNETIDFYVQGYKKSGGTALNLINLTENCVNLECFIAEYERNIKVSRILRESGLDVIVTIGPYPINILAMHRIFNSTEIFEIYRMATKHAIKLISEGKANAIGEVGRFHFEVERTYQEEANEILKMIACEAHDQNIPLIIHSESLDDRGMCQLSNDLTKSCGNLKIVKHFSKPIYNLNCGIIPSVPASRDNARKAPWGKKGFFLETDFAGDENNPNFVLPLDSVPRRVKMLMQEGVDIDNINSSMNYYKDFYI
jgi:Predicted metal-dependent hydrolase (urease superfamily)